MECPTEIRLDQVAPPCAAFYVRPMQVLLPQFNPDRMSVGLKPIHNESGIIAHTILISIRRTRYIPIIFFSEPPRKPDRDTLADLITQQFLHQTLYVSIFTHDPTVGSVILPMTVIVRKFQKKLSIWIMPANLKEQERRVRTTAPRLQNHQTARLLKYRRGLLN